MQVGFSIQKSLFNVGTEADCPGTVDFVIPPQSFTVILLNTFDFQHFLA